MSKPRSQMEGPRPGRTGGRERCRDGEAKRRFATGCGPVNYSHKPFCQTRTVLSRHREPARNRQRDPPLAPSAQHVQAAQPKGEGGKRLVDEPVPPDGELVEPPRLLVTVYRGQRLLDAEIGEQFPLAVLEPAIRVAEGVRFKPELGGET